MTANEELAEAHKQIVMLREAIVGLWGSPYWKPHNAPMSVILPLQKALDATQDLSGLVLCEAEPVAWMRDAGEPSLSTMSHCIPNTVKDIWLKVNPKNVERYTIPLYQARKAK